MYVLEKEHVVSALSYTTQVKKCFKCNLNSVKRLNLKYQKASVGQNIGIHKINHR